MTRDFPQSLIPPVPPRQNASKSGKKKKGQQDDDGDNFDEEPLFPKYENIFQFTPKDPKTSRSKDEKVVDGNPHNSSLNDTVTGSLPHTGPEDVDDQLGYRPLRCVYFTMCVVCIYMCVCVCTNVYVHKSKRVKISLPYTHVSSYAHLQYTTHMYTHTHMFMHKEVHILMLM